MAGASLHEKSRPFFRLVSWIVFWRGIFAARPANVLRDVPFTPTSFEQVVRPHYQQYSCRGRCQQFQETAKCQCNHNCFRRKNCCDDYIFACRLADEVEKKHSKLGQEYDDMTRDQMFVPTMAVVLFFTLSAGFTLVRLMTSWFDARNFNDGPWRRSYGFLDLILVYRFSHPAVEKKYKSWSEERQIRSAGGMFAFVLVLEGVSAVFEAYSWRKNTVASTMFILLGTSYVSLFLLSVHVSIHPRRLSYYATLLGCFALKVVAQGPPLSPSCAYLMAKPEDCPSLAFSLDCSMYSKTTQHQMIVWVLLSSWMMAFHEDIYLVLIWLLGFVLTSRAAENILDQDIIPSSTKNRIYIFYIFAFFVAAAVRKSQEFSMRHRYYHEVESRAAAQSMFGTLDDMVPEHLVVPMMTKLGGTISEDLPCVSVLFILIADFDTVTKAMTPTMLLTFLNVTFSGIDDILHEQRVTKIETVGEEYVAAVGVSPLDQNQSETGGHTILLDRLFDSASKIVTKLSAVHALQVTKLDSEDSSNAAVNIKIKMGVQTGPIVAGIVGKKLPRYRLFGDTMNSAARMMQKAVPGTLQFGRSTFDSLSPGLKSSVEYRGKVEMKGKGAIDCWTFSGTRCQEDDSGRVTLDKGKLFAGIQQLVQDERESKTLNAKFERASLELSKQEKLKTHPFHMDAEMSQKWLVAHHDDNFASARLPRVGITCMVVLIFTTYEYYLSGFYMAVYKYPHQVWPYGRRLSIFLGLRVCVMLLLMKNWYIGAIPTPDNKSDRDRKMWAIGFQNLFMFFDAACLICVGLSYDALYFSNSDMHHDMMNFLIEHKWYAPPGDQRFRIQAVILLHLILFIHPYRYWQVVFWFPFLLIWDFMHVIVGCFADPARRDGEPYQSTGKLLFMAQGLLRIASAIKDEHDDRKLFFQKQHVMNMQSHSTRILDTLLPAGVFQEMALNAQQMPCHQYRHAVIAQSDLCGFTNLMSTKTPHQVVSYMGSLFGIFDDLTDLHQVYKIETVGDAYIAGMAEPPLSDLYSPVNVIVFGLDMVRAVDDWSLSLDAGVTCRVGIHYGEVIGGIVGKTAKRYHLFGETMTILEVLESTCFEGRVQVSGCCKAEVERQLMDNPLVGLEDVDFSMREDLELSTSKGEKHSYDEVGGPTYLVESEEKPLRHVPTERL